MNATLRQPEPSTHPSGGLDQSFLRSESADFVDLGEAILGLSDHLDPRIDTAAPDSLDTALRHHLIVNAVFNEAEDLHAHLALGRRLYLDDHAGLRQHPNW